MENLSTLVVDPVPLRMLAAALAGDGACVAHRCALDPPDTGCTGGATAACLRQLERSTHALGDDVRLLGRRLVGFVTDVSETDDRVTSTLRRLQQEL